MNHTYYSDDKTAVMGKMLYGSFTMDALENVKTKDKVEYGVINYNGASSLETAETYIVEFTYFEPPYQSGIAAVTDDFARLHLILMIRVSLRQSGGIIIRKKNLRNKAY